MNYFGKNGNRLRFGLMNQCECMLQLVHAPIDFVVVD
jgi:hypothetical protein